MTGHAVVMGAGRGLGRAVARALARDGWHVHVLARTEADLKSLTEEISGTPHTVDVADAAALQAALGDIDRRHPVEALVCNAGGPPPGGLADLDDPAWLAGWNLTLMSAVRAIRVLAPAMAGRGSGRVVVLGSSSVRRPIDGLLLSNVYRAGVLALVTSLAPELARQGVTVNMVSPGRFDTGRVRQLDAARAARRGVPVEQERADSIRGIPAGRYGDPAELADLVAYLVSPPAGYLTGQSILIDGGLVHALPHGNP
jgi:3-oxoacyl-[acyl-carrier protein] reductase